MGKYGLPEPSAKISIASARMRDIRRRFLDRFTRSQTGRTDSILDTTQESPLTISVNTFELPDNAVSASTASAGALVEKYGVPLSQLPFRCDLIIAYYAIVQLGKGFLRWPLQLPVSLWKSKLLVIHLSQEGLPLRLTRTYPSTPRSKA